MKVLKPFLISLFVSVIIVSCKKDDSSDVTAPDIAGKWEVKSVTSTGSLKATKEGEETIDYDFEATAANFDNCIYTFSKDPNVVVTEGKFDLYVTRLDTDVTSKTEVKLGASGTWNKNEDILKITVNNEVIENKIIQLTNETLKVDFKATTKSIQDGYDVEAVEETKYIFSKKE